MLQAADILLYLADRVPVGEDQRQHLELARDIAQRFNSRYGTLFPPPQAAIPPTAARISDLQEPERKMSTSSLSSEDGKLLMLDPPDVIRRKFKRAVTDSGSEVRHDWETKPGVSNLLEILHGVTGEPIPALEASYAGKGYGHLKQDVAEAVVEYFTPIRERHAALMADPGELDRLMALGASRAREIAAPVLADAKRRMGLLPGAPRPALGSPSGATFAAWTSTISPIASGDAVTRRKPWEERAMRDPLAIGLFVLMLVPVAIDRISYRLTVIIFTPLWLLWLARLDVHSPHDRRERDDR